MLESYADPIDKRTDGALRGAVGQCKHAQQRATEGERRGAIVSRGTTRCHVCGQSIRLAFDTLGFLYTPRHLPPEETETPQVDKNLPPLF